MSTVENQPHFCPPSRRRQELDKRAVLGHWRNPQSCRDFSGLHYKVMWDLTKGFSQE